jgi:branched-chain amino acid transport system permease protein
MDGISVPRFDKSRIHLLFYCKIHLLRTAMLLRLLTIGLSNGAIIALNAIAVTVAYSVVRKINFAHGDMFALLSVLVTALVAASGLQAGTPLPILLGTLVLILLLTAGAGALFGATIERVAFRPFRRNATIAPLIATIGISFMLYQAALGLRYLTNIYIRGEHRSVPGVPELPRIRVPDLLPDVNLVRALGLPIRLTISLHDLFVLGLAVGLAFAVNYLMQRTRLGRMLRACTDDPEMAQLCGVSYNRAVRSAFALSGALAGVAACAFALYYGQPFTQYGAQSGLIAFMAAVLGGIGRPIGALLAGLVLGVVAAFSDYFLTTQWTPVLLMGILLVLLFLRPRGLRDEGGSDGVNQETIGTSRNRLNRGQVIAFLGLFALGLVYPLIDQLFVWRQLFVVTGILVAVLLALGLNIVLGQAGMLDLGYGAFFGIGAYTTGLLISSASPFALGNWGEFLLIMAISGGIAGLLGIANGILTLRLRGEYLAITTLAFGQIVPQVVRNLDVWTGGAAGMAALPPPQLLGMDLTSATQRYYLALALVCLVALGSLLLVRSRLGRAWAALQMDELAAIHCGIAPLPTRVLAFVLGATIAGSAGALFATTFSYVDPTQTEFQLSAMTLAMVVVGGAGSVLGSLLGGIAIAGYDRLLIPQLGGALTMLGNSLNLPILAAIDLRNLNFLWFGLALYVTTLVRGRQSTE